MWDAVGVAVALIIFLGPLALAAWLDRRRAEAQAIQAEVGGEIGRAVGRGLFAVRVVPAFLRGGTVYLGGEGLPEALCRRAAAIAERLAPEEYHVRRGRGRRTFDVDWGRWQLCHCVRGG